MKPQFLMDECALLVACLLLILILLSDNFDVVTDRLHPWCPSDERHTWYSVSVSARNGITVCTQVLSTATKVVRTRMLITKQVLVKSRD